MKQYLFVMLFLIACSQPEQQIAPAVIIIDEGCQATQTIGESCEENCDCLRPGKCLNGICSLVNLQDGQSCFANQQCQSGYCESNICGIQESKSFECERVCKDSYNDEPSDCSTVCRQSNQ